MVHITYSNIALESLDHISVLPVKFEKRKHVPNEYKLI